MVVAGGPALAAPTGASGAVGVALGGLPGGPGAGRPALVRVGAGGLDAKHALPGHDGLLSYFEPNGSLKNVFKSGDIAQKKR